MHISGYKIGHQSTQAFLRTCFLALIVTALGGTWVLEQPRGSVYDFFRPFQSLLATLYEVYGSSAVTGLEQFVCFIFFCIVGINEDAFINGCLIFSNWSVPVFEVTRCKWYMLHYTSPSPKPLFAYSNSAAVAQLNMGKLVNWKKQKASAVKGGYHIQTCETYYDASGRKRFKGTKQLRRTEFLIWIVFRKMFLLFDFFLFFRKQTYWNITERHFPKHQSLAILCPCSPLQSEGIPCPIWIQNGRFISWFDHDQPWPSKCSRPTPFGNSVLPCHARLHRWFGVRQFGKRFQVFAPWETFEDPAGMAAPCSKARCHFWQIGVRN